MLELPGTFADGLRCTTREGVRILQSFGLGWWRVMLLSRMSKRRGSLRGISRAGRGESLRGGICSPPSLPLGDYGVTGPPSRGGWV